MTPEVSVIIPNMNGLQSSLAIRQSGIEVPIIAVTASAIKEEMSKAFDAGMNDFITKPFKKNDLLPVIEKWTQGTRSEASGPQSETPGQPEVAGSLSETPGSRSEKAAAILQEQEKTVEESPVMDFEKAVETFMGNQDVVLKVLKDGSM